MKIKFIFAVVLIASVTACAGGGGEASAPTSGLGPYHGIAVPPDPGAAGDATLVGVDTDANGIRDEVDRAIAQAYGGDAKKYVVAQKFLRVQQAYLRTDTNDPVAALAAFQRSAESGGCAYDELDDAALALEIVHRGEALTLNTPERRAQKGKVVAAAAAASGGALVIRGVAVCP